MPKKNVPAKLDHPWRARMYPPAPGDPRAFQPKRRRVVSVCSFCGVPDQLPHADGCAEYKDALGDLYRK